ncbi:MAG: hypothetical protein JWR66_2584 [Modestobacter sp.]|nr:hypothetical protein [Modestobacter sp.]
MHYVIDFFVVLGIAVGYGWWRRGRRPSGRDGSA